MPSQPRAFTPSEPRACPLDQPGRCLASQHPSPSASPCLASLSMEEQEQQQHAWHVRPAAQQMHDLEMFLLASAATRALALVHATLSATCGQQRKPPSCGRCLPPWRVRARRCWTRSGPWTPRTRPSTAGEGGGGESRRRAWETSGRRRGRRRRVLKVTESRLLSGGDGERVVHECGWT